MFKLIKKSAIACCCLCCCSRSAKYKRCVDSLVCTKSDRLYRLYLVHVGNANTFLYLCENDTLNGCIIIVFTLHYIT